MVWDRPRIDPILLDPTRDLTGLRVIVEDLYGDVRRGVLRPAETRLYRNGLGITPDRALIRDGGDGRQDRRKIDDRVIRLTVDDRRPALPECPGWYTAWDRLAAVHVHRFDGRLWRYAGNVDGTADPAILDAPLTPIEFARAHPDFEDGGMRAVAFADRLASPCGTDRGRR